MPTEPLYDDLGKSFTGDQLASVPSELDRVVRRRSLGDAHLGLIVGAAAIGFSFLIPPSPSTHSWRQPSSRLQGFALGCVVFAAARYVGIGAKAGTNRRALLKRRLCPVCLKPLDKHNIHGEVITCPCGATWERRFM